MKSQLNILNQLQEPVLTRDEHHRIGDGSHMDSLDQSIDSLVDKLEPQPKDLYQRLYKKDHIVMSPMVNGCCAVCGMRLPISQVQQVRLATPLLHRTPLRAPVPTHSAQQPLQNVRPLSNLPPRSQFQRAQLLS